MDIFFSNTPDNRNPSDSPTEHSAYLKHNILNEVRLNEKLLFNRIEPYPKKNYKLRNRMKKVMK